MGMVRQSMCLSSPLQLDADRPSGSGERNGFGVFQVLRNQPDNLCPLTEIVGKL